MSGQFTPVIGAGSPFSQVHFFPKNGNRITIAGKERKIPHGVGVVWGGVVGTYNDATIERVPHQTLAPNTLYFVYVYWDGQMRMDFSQMTHREDAYFGNEVHASDPTRSLVGMVYTDANGQFRGDDKRQNTLSWFNPVRTLLSKRIPSISTSSSSFVEIDAANRLEFLQWGINSTFNEAFIRSNVLLSGYGGNSVAGAVVGTAIGFNGTGPAGTCAHTSVTAGALGALVSQGASPQTEGHHYAQVFLMASGGGTATLNEATFSLNVLTS